MDPLSSQSAPNNIDPGVRQPLSTQETQLQPTPSSSLSYLATQELVKRTTLTNRDVNADFLAEEAQFHERWKSEIALEFRRAFLRSWAIALKTVGTPLSFCNNAAATAEQVQIFGAHYSYLQFDPGAYDKRAEFMLNQPAYKGIFSAEQYPFRSDLADCKLCQTIAFGIDSQLLGADPVFMVDYGDYVIIPNRYPNAPGSSLLMPKDHDDLSNRNPVLRDLRTGICTFPMIPNRTFGNILTVDALHIMMKVADRFDLIGIRNHPLEGMSVPLHDHFQLYLKEVSVCSILRGWAESAEQSQLENGVLPPSYTPFDTLLLRGERAELAELGARITGRLEQDQQVYTIGYYNGALFISPRYPGCYRNAAGALGGSTLLHVRSTNDPIYWDKIQHYVPRKGEFPWASYFDS